MLLEAPAEIRGLQTPPIESLPEFTSSAGDDAIELAQLAGLELDPWQQYVLRNSLGERPDGRWAAFEVGLIVPRQNGKGSIIEARELAGLFLLGEGLILHTAHEFKALDVATPILTASGWSTMGELKDGDQVFAPDGSLTDVIAHPVRFDRPCFEVCFDDGQVVVADAEHLWGVTDAKTGQFAVLTTAQLLEAGVSETRQRTGRNRKTYRWRVQIAEPLIGATSTSLPIAPWLLGAWLGDGTTSKGELTCGAADLAFVTSQLDRLGETYRVRPDRRWPDRVFTIVVDGLRQRLLQLGLLGDKHIPEKYMLASVGDRRELLAGVMDTDGTVSAHQIAVTMVKARLMDDVASLVRSLGYKATLREFRARLNGSDAGPMYRVQFSASQDISPFKLPRKTAKIRAKQSRATRSCYNAIVDIRRVESRPTRCITVAHESAMYNVGRGFIPTHNTCAEGFRRVLYLIENAPDLDRQVKRVTRSHGDEGIELKTGQRLRFIARSNGSGRGFSGDCIILDESMILSAEAMGALLPTLSARPNPQVWYASSAGDQNSTQLARVVRRGRAGDDPNLAYFEWAANDDDSHNDPASWAKANPGLGIRISHEHIAREQAAMDPTHFGRERLGITVYPAEEGDEWAVITQDEWALSTDVASELEDPVAFAIDVAPDRSFATIAAAGTRQDGLQHVEIVEHSPGTSWVLNRLLQLSKRWNPTDVALDPAGPAGSLLPALERNDVSVLATTGRELTQACGAFYDAVTEGPHLMHRGQIELTAAVSGARKRSLGDAWAWSRRDSSVNLSPLVAATLALFAHNSGESNQVGVRSLDDYIDDDSSDDWDWEDD